MTSEKYYLNWLKEAGRGHVTAILSWGSYCLLLGSILLRLQFDLLYTFFGIGRNSLLLFICMGLGIALGLTEFYYLLQERKQDFYFSLPVKKTTIFYTRYLHGLFHGLLPMIGYMLICGIYQSSVDPVFMKYSVGYTFYSILAYGMVFLLFYHITVFAVGACGRMIAALCMLGAILYGMQFFLQSVCLVFMKSFYRTYFKSPFLELTENVLVPWKLGAMLTKQERSEKFQLLEMKPEVIFLLAGFAWIVLFLILAVIAAKYRRTESVGRVFSISSVGRITGDVLSILAGTGACGMLLIVSDIEEWKRISAILLLAVTGIVTVMVAHFLYERLVYGGRSHVQKRAAMGNRKLFPIAECIWVAVIVATLAGSAEAYDSYLPKDAEVERLGIVVAGVDMDEETYADMKNERDTYLIENRMECYTLREEGKDAGMKWLRTLHTDMEDEKEGGESGGQVTVFFEKKNGSRSYRRYELSERLLYAFADVYETEEYKRAAYPMITEETEVTEGARVVWHDGVTRKTLRLKEAEKAEFLTLYKSDVEAMKMADLQKGFPLGELEMQSEIYDWECEGMIYPTFEKCRAFLNKHGADTTKQVTDYPMKGITLWKTGVSAEGSSGGVTMHRLEAEKELAEWRGRLVPKEFCIQPILCPADTQVDAEVEVTEKESGAVIYVECYGR